MSTKRISHTDFKKELLQDDEVRKNYDVLNEEFQLLNEMLKARKRAGASQASVAKKMKTTSSVVSRLESLNIKGVLPVRAVYIS